MAKESVSKLKKIQTEVREFLEEKGIVRADGTEPSKLHKFCHFWLLVGRSFSKNRCPVRASALAYATLLALIPMLAVALSVSTSILKKDGEERILGLVNQFVDSGMPPAPLTNSPPEDSIKGRLPTAEQIHKQQKSRVQRMNPRRTMRGEARIVEPATQVCTQAGRQTHPRFHSEYPERHLGHYRNGAAFVCGHLHVEPDRGTFNDIWGVAQGRSWGARIVQYWAVITLGPILLAAILGLSNGPHFAATKQLLETMPFIGSLLFPICAGDSTVPGVCACFTC